MPAASRRGQSSDQNERRDTGAKARNLPRTEMCGFDGSAARGKQQRGGHELKAITKGGRQAPILRRGIEVARSLLKPEARGDARVVFQLSHAARSARAECE